jgi:hypothetical protein
METIGPHPQPGQAFNLWFARLEHNINSFVHCDVTSPEFAACVTNIARISEEVLYELASNPNRTGSVYDRSDYVIRELLRTTKVSTIIHWCRQVAELLRRGSFTLAPEGLLKNGDNEVPPDVFQALILLIPTIMRLCFTAEETIGVVNIDQLLKFVYETIGAADGNIELAIHRNPQQTTIFEVAPIIITACIGHLKILNTSLFFSQFRELGLFAGFVKLAIRAKEFNQEVLLDRTIECLNAYIQAAQSEPDRKQAQTDPAFVRLYRTMMEQVVDPEIKEKAGNRSKFRSILFYSRSLKGDARPP